MSRRTLFVTGFHPDTRARDLAYEFERYGRLIRCDIPAPKGPRSRPFAFVEFEESSWADDAYHDMHGRRFEGYPLDIQWAKHTPSSQWRSGPRGRYGRRGSRSRSPYGRRSRSPPRYRRSISPASRSRSRSYSRGRSLSRSRSRTPHRGDSPVRGRSPTARSLSRSPRQQRRNSPSPDKGEETPST
ncbi:hypothetical protein BDF22DRAFT_776249 [Syncephalis plumigaleata]|nr:hypothetical protein BDF22DRAFT_776249 [Syncephalis plumigaleata]